MPCQIVNNTLLTVAIQISRGLLIHVKSLVEFVNQARSFLLNYILQIEIGIIQLKSYHTSEIYNEIFIRQGWNQARL